MKYKADTWFYITCLIITTLVCNQYFGFAVNITNSLPYKVFITYQKTNPSVGNYISFTAPLESGFPEGTIITKKILAGPGDVVTKKDRDFYINDKWISTAKLHSREGEVLVLGSEGRLQKGQYYVGAPHIDSFDSRYQKMGWINSEQIVAVAYPIF